MKNVAFCPTFATTVVSYHLLELQGLRWDTTPVPPNPSAIVRRRDNEPICAVTRQYSQFVLQYVPGPDEDAPEVAMMARVKRSMARKIPEAEARLWHERLGHPGSQALEKLGQRLRVKIKGPKTVECEACAQGAAKRQVSRRPPIRTRIPGEELWIDWTDLTPDSRNTTRPPSVTIFDGLNTARIRR